MSAVQTKKNALIGLLLLSIAAAQVSCGGKGTATTATSTTTTTTTTTSSVVSLQPYATPTGTVSTYTAAGSIDTTGVFFQPLGTNGRSCANCHQLNQGMSINASSIQALYTSTNGTDPLFQAADGANCPTVAADDAEGHSLVRNNGLIRIAITPPATAQFVIANTQDPYGCAVTTNTSTGEPAYSVYRRPLPATSLTFLSDVMWDTRETVNPLDSAATFDTNLNSDLSAQVLEAVQTHEQSSTTPTAEQVTALVQFEQGLYTAQATDTLAGSLNGNGATGGAANLAVLRYTPGVNNPTGPAAPGTIFNPNVFTLFTAWTNSPNTQQASIARGENIFNTAPVTIANVRGVNDNSTIGSPPTLRASCSFCHNNPNVGNNSVSLTIDTGISHLAASETDPGTLAGLAQLSAPSLPTYQLTGCSDINGNPVVYVTTDPGIGLFSGLCTDVNRVKVPTLRGLAARAPYFHNGSAASLTQLVNFYNARFKINLTPQQLTDLTNFLNAL